MTQSVSEAGPGTPETVELLAIAVKYNAVRCRRLTDGGIVTLRLAGGVRDEVEGQILTIVPVKEWSYMRGHYLSGKVVAARVDMAAVAARFRLPPLALRPEGIWHPLEEDWLGLDLDEILAEQDGAADPGEILAEEGGAEDNICQVEVPLVGGTVNPNGDRRRREAASCDEGEGRDEEQRWREAVLQALLRHPDVSPREREIILAGPRPAYEMEQVVPGANWEEMIDPISHSVELKKAGDWEGARRLLHKCLEADLRCLDAYAHLGNMYFGKGKWQGEVERALHTYLAGVQMGDLALGPEFRGVLPWGMIDNRPFLRCLHGLGLALWRLGRTDEARAVFVRMLWLNPMDNQGARFLLADLDAGKTYLEMSEEEERRWRHLYGDRSP
ncbi:MAG: tetratricopeptide repeat protein [Bacillota bacterium]